MDWITPKTNWTKDDYYNATDLNRVENNTKVIADMLGIAISTIITDRNYTSLEFYDSLNRIEANIEALHTLSMAWTTMKTSWKNDNEQKFNYEDANRLEINLLNLYTILYNNLKARKYCGQTICGGGIL
jgi:hypothetical protein